MTVSDHCSCLIWLAQVFDLMVLKWLYLIQYSDGSETWGELSIILTAQLCVGFGLTFSFIFAPCAWAVYVETMLGLNYVMSKHKENNTWVSHSVSVNTSRGGLSSSLDNTKCSSRLRSLRKQTLIMWGWIVFFKCALDRSFNDFLSQTLAVFRAMNYIQEERKFSTGWNDFFPP